MAKHLLDRETRQEQRFRMTYEEYLAWVDDDVHSEWVDGEVTVFVPPDEPHQDTALFLSRLLADYIDFRRLGKLLFAPFEMRILGGVASREPDLLFVATAHLDRFDGKRLDGPADLAVEILSEHSVARDRREKFAQYAAAGVPEYWLIDPHDERRRFEPFALAPDGRYAPIAPDAAGRFHSTVLPGFWLDPAWLTQEPLPDPHAAMFAIVGEEYLRDLQAMFARQQAVKGDRS